MANGYFQELNQGSPNNFPMVITSPVTIDTTTSHALDVTIQWGTADPSNTITSTNVIVWVIN